jgi:hypothetical protein
LDNLNLFVFANASKKIVVLKFFFVFFFSTPVMVGPSAETGTVELAMASRYESASYSPDLQRLIQAMPSWVAITGNAHVGTIVVETQWLF